MVVGAIVFVVCLIGYFIIDALITAIVSPRQESYLPEYEKTKPYKVQKLEYKKKKNFSALDIWDVKSSLREMRGHADVQAFFKQHGIRVEEADGDFIEAYKYQSVNTGAMQPGGFVSKARDAFKQTEGVWTDSARYWIKDEAKALKNRYAFMPEEDKGRVVLVLELVRENAPLLLSNYGDATLNYNLESYKKHLCDVLLSALEAHQNHEARTKASEEAKKAEAALKASNDVKLEQERQNQLNKLRNKG